MLDLNEIHLTGRIVRDVELRSNTNGSKFVWFSLAVNSKLDREGEGQADFLTCQIWGKSAELLAKFGKKGTRLLINRGALRSFTKEDEAGVRRCYTYILISNYGFLDGLKEAKESGFFEDMGEAIDF